MSERYTKLYELPENLYAETSLVIISAGVLLRDNYGEAILAQIKFKSLSNKTIIMLKVELTCFDSVDREISDKVAYTYLDIKAERNSTFGDRTPIKLPEMTRKFSIRIIEVNFDDNTWINMPEVDWQPLPNMLVEMSEYQKLTYNARIYKDGKYAPKEYKDLWTCSCGEINKSCDSKCSHCGKLFEKLFALDMQSLEKDGVYEVARQLSISSFKSNVIEAKRLFESIIEWKDTVEQIEKCNKKIDDINAKEEAARLEKERQAEIAHNEAERIAKRNKKIVIITTLIVCAIIAFIIVWNTVIVPNNKYNAAIALMDAGKYTEAISAFESLDGYKDSAIKIVECNAAILDGKYNTAIALLDAGNIVEAYEALIELDGYKDSADKADSIYDKYKVEKLKVAKAGDYVFFGAYEQDNNTSNGKENIEWLVLEVEGGKVLVISKYALDCKPYNTNFTDITWETCTLREWLNNDFIKSTFSADELAMIPVVTISADKNPEYSTDAGNATQDQVFLLSSIESKTYFSSDSARQCEPTDYAYENGALLYMWLRSPGLIRNTAASVSWEGFVDEFGVSVDLEFIAVRPALWIDLNA